MIGIPMRDLNICENYWPSSCLVIKIKQINDFISRILFDNFIVKVIFYVFGCRSCAITSRQTQVYIIRVRMKQARNAVHT